MRTGFGLQVMVGGCNWGCRQNDPSLCDCRSVLLTRSYDYASSLKTHNYPPVDGLTQKALIQKFWTHHCRFVRSSTPILIGRHGFSSTHDFNGSCSKVRIAPYLGVSK